MKRKTLFKLVLLYYISLYCVSCNTSNGVKVGFLFPHMLSDRYVKEKLFFTAKIKDLGGEAIITSADNNDQTQIQQATDLINQGVKVLVVNPLNSNTAATIVRNAHYKGVKVIAYDRLIKNCDLDYYLTFDNEKVGKLMAEYVTKIKPNGNYILLGGDKSDQNAVWVKNGQKSALTPFLSSGSIKIVYDCYIESWSGDNARNEMKKYIDLSNSTPDVILSAYDGMSTGVIDLLMAYNLAGKVLITGQDAELAACRNIVKGYQIMTIYKPVKQLAIKAAELSMKLAKNEKITDAKKTIDNDQVEVPTIFLDPIVVDKNNLKTTVIADGYMLEKDIYSNQ